ncbi:MAG: hypothetical protein WCC10_14945 [Tumebacillaceae bacterium]
MSSFALILALHLIAVVIKIGVLFYIPFLKNVEMIRKFLGLYKKIDRYADWSLWLTGASMFLVTSWEYLLQMWMLVSMLLYTLIFYVIKRVIVGRMNKIIESNKVFARDEIKTLKVENYCVIVVSIGLLGAIGALMVNKPF